MLSWSRGQANFRGFEASTPRPRTSKCVLEDSTSVKNLGYRTDSLQTFTATDWIRLPVAYMPLRSQNHHRLLSAWPKHSHYSETFQAYIIKISLEIKRFSISFSVKRKLKPTPEVARHFGNLQVQLDKFSFQVCFWNTTVVQAELQSSQVDP